MTKAGILSAGVKSDKVLEVIGMRLSNKKMLAVFMAAGLLTGSAVSAAPVETNGEVALGATVDSGILEGAPDGTLAINPLVRQIGVRKAVFKDSVYQGDNKLMDYEWNELYLVDGDGRSMLSTSSFPMLKGALEEFNHQERSQASNARKGMCKQAASEIQSRKESGSSGYFNPYYYNDKIRVRRADSQVMSFICERSSFTNGAHGMYGFIGVNFDSQTGKRLELTDVFWNIESLPDIVIEVLRSVYPARTFYEDMEKIVTKTILEGSVIWTLGPRGVSFYFNPYEISPYASGLLTAEIMFDERPGLFREKYGKGPDSYCEEISGWSPSSVVLKDDGTGKSEKLGVFYDGDGLSINLGEASYREKCDIHDVEAVFVHKDGLNFVYVDCVPAKLGENRPREIRVYDLNGARPVSLGSMDRTFYSVQSLADIEKKRSWQWVMNDPREFRIDESYMTGTGNSKTHVVELGNYGRPAYG